MKKLLESFFNRHNLSSCVFEHNTAQIYITNALFIKERSLHRIYTHTYIYIVKQRRKNEFWRHAPRGRTEGNTHHTHNRFVLSYAFSSLTRRLLFVAAVPHDEKKSNPSFFFPAFAREFIGGVDLFFLKDDDRSLCVCCGVFDREIGFSKTLSS